MDVDPSTAHRDPVPPAVGHGIQRGNGAGVHLAPACAIGRRQHQSLVAYGNKLPVAVMNAVQIGRGRKCHGLPTGWISGYVHAATLTEYEILPAIVDDRIE